MVAGTAEAEAEEGLACQEAVAAWCAAVVAAPVVAGEGERGGSV